MEREVLGKKSPLFGRRTAQIPLRPFGYREAALFHPGYSRTDQARTYFLCGGVPLYLKRFSDSRSIEANIAAELLDEYAPLYREADFLLREELREVTLYYAILAALAAGHSTVQEIARQAGQDAARPRLLPPAAHRAGLHRAALPPDRRAPRRPAPSTTTSRTLSSASGSASSSPAPATSATWERTARCATSSAPTSTPTSAAASSASAAKPSPGSTVRKGVTAAFEVGQYWSKTTQIDVVGLRDDGWTDLGECKWGTVRSPKAVEKELEEKVREFPNPRGATIGRRIFTRQAPPVGAGGGVRWFGLEEMYA